MTLETYDLNRACPKCGSHDMNLFYDGEKALMKRICSSCRHTWYEKPLDDVKESGGSGAERIQEDE